MGRTYTSDELDEMTDEELEELEASYYETIYGHLSCYSTTDLRNHESIRAEMFDRGMDVNPISHRDEDKNLTPEKDTVVFEDSDSSML